jgi:prepilin-type N-terminal cleavage/methylation domain-containing protein
MIDREPTTQHAFSLIEVVVALVILGILSAFAIIAIGRSRKDLERQNVAKEFKISLERARFDSVKRRASDCNNMSRVEITSATSFTLLTDSC